MNIDVWEVIDAAKTKPFGFMPFYPGPGLGGHCIPIDPFYLSWKARQNGFECRFIELAGHVNGSMPAFVVERVAEALNTVKKAINGSKVHLFGVAYKKDVERHARIAGARRAGAAAPARAPCSATPTRTCRCSSTATSTSVQRRKRRPLMALIAPSSAPNHSVFDYERMVARFPLIVDTRNALKGFDEQHIYRL